MAREEEEERNSKWSYIKRILDKFNMKFCMPCISLIQKSEKFSKSQYPQNNCEITGVRKFLILPLLTVLCIFKFAHVLILLEHIPTELMIADPLTKGLSVKVFVEHVSRMGVMKSFWYIGLVGVFLLCICENVFGWVQEGGELNFERFLFFLNLWKQFSQTEKF